MTVIRAFGGSHAGHCYRPLDRASANRPIVPQLHFESMKPDLGV